MFTQMDHVAVSVKDMEKAIAFYEDVIGLEKVFDREFDDPMAKLIGVAAIELLSTGGKCQKVVSKQI